MILVKKHDFDERWCFNFFRGKVVTRMSLKKPRAINVTRFKFIDKFSLTETSKMADALQIYDSCSPFTVEVLLTENRAQNKIELIVLSYALGNEARRNADK